MAFSPLRVLLGTALLTVVVASPVAAQVSFDPVDEVLGTIGITSRNRPHIDYRERAPLVVPPSGTRLRPPEERAASRGQRWPNDPDVVARRRAAEEARAPRVSDERYDELYVKDGGTRRNRYAGVPTQGQGGGDGGYNPARSVTPEQLRQIQASADATPTPTGGEPRREVLTDPPKGYRRGTGPVKGTIEPMRTGDDLQINLNAPRY